MSETPNLLLPLVQPSQAQKHVTVNEALARLDGLVQLRLVSVEQLDAPVSVIDGESYFVPSGATGAWSGQDGLIALAVNGGWEFLSPVPGWRAWIQDQGTEGVWSGTAWRTEVRTGSSVGAGLKIQVAHFDHVLGAGASELSSDVIPANSMVFAVSARVLTPLTGSLNSWEMGLSSSPSQFGNGMGLGQGSYCHGLLSSPTTFYSATPIRFGAIGGMFSGGSLRVAMHYATLDLPEV